MYRLFTTLAESTGCRFCADFDSRSRRKRDVPCPMTNGERCAPCTKLKQLEAQILQAKKTLDDLLEHHRATRSQVNRAHDPIIHRLPSEIASSIFRFCLPLVPADGILSMKKQEFRLPLALGTVCRYWRKIAWSTPQLWSLIAICIGEWSNFDMLLKISREWLSRSGSLPVSIGFRVSCQPRDIHLRHPKSMGAFDSLFELVNQHSNRWQMLDISVPSSLLTRFRGDWNKRPLLQTLHLAGTDRPLDEEGKFDVHDLKPSPEELFLDRVPLKLVEIEWSRLTHVTVIKIAPADCLGILRHSPQLKFCEVKEMKHPRAPHGDIVVHNQLQQLVLRCQEPLASSFLRSVTFPALEILECSDQFPADHISIMLGRSSFLTKLTLDIVDIEQDKFISILGTVPSLQHLEVCVTKDKAPSPDALLRLLATTSIINQHGPSIQKFLPTLRCFAYRRPHSSIGYAWSFIPDIFGRLSDLANPRRRPLEKVILSFGLYEKEPRTYLSKKSLPRFLALLNNGLDLSIRFGEREANMDFIRLSADYHNMGQGDRYK